jgi:hypothetical protein
MMVGPILERHGLSLRDDTVRQAAEGGAMAASGVASSRPQETSRTNLQSGGVKSSPFYFGSANSVIERDEKSSKFWVRLPNCSTQGVDWVKLDCRESSRKSVAFTPLGYDSVH